LIALSSFTKPRFVEKIVTNKISLPWHLNPRRSEEVLDKIVGIFVESKPEIQDKILNDEISFDDAKEQNALIQEVTRKLGAAKARRRLGERRKICYRYVHVTMQLPAPYYYY
jgi:hypothetical protein